MFLLSVVCKIWRTVGARLHAFSERGVLRFFGSVCGLKSHIVYMPDRSEISVRPHFSVRSKWPYRKFSTVQKIHVNAKKFQFGVVVALFIGPTINRTQKNYWNCFFQAFLTTGEIFIFEVCGKHSARLNVTTTPSRNWKFSPYRNTSCKQDRNLERSGFQTVPKIHVNGP